MFLKIHAHASKLSVAETLVPSASFQISPMAGPGLVLGTHSNMTHVPSESVQIVHTG